MIKRGHISGFTIVELSVVVIVIAILATLVALTYGNSQMQARDTQMRDAADKFADAIKLMQLKTGSFPKGGSASTVAATAADGCIDGANGYETGNFYAMSGSSSYKCTLGDAAMAMGYLPNGFFDDLPVNALSSGRGRIFMVYGCGTSKYLFYSLENPTTDETSALDTVAAGCGSAATARDTYKMRAVKNLSAY